MPSSRMSFEPAVAEADAVTVPLGVAEAAAPADSVAEGEDVSDAVGEAVGVGGV